MNPIIGIMTNEIVQISPSGGPRTITMLQEPFLALATDRGACPLLVSCRTEPADARGLAELLDGLILIGGQDVDPASYGQESKVEYLESVRGFGSRYRRAASNRPDRRRDDVEIALYRAARDRGIPVLGICRGLQIINVAEGGTLHQELPESNTHHYFEEDGWINHHEIAIERGSLTHHLLGTEVYYTSSLHHQGIDDLAPSLRASGGVEGVEIIEGIAPRGFVFATHGHLELTRANLRRYENVLDAFMSHAREARRKRGSGTDLAGSTSDVRRS
jgi:putative glutamine amidotransferase